MLAVAMTVHLLSVVIWVGGMFFTYMILRPVAASLFEPPVLIPFWSRIFAHFFLWVWIASSVLLLSGLWMLFAYGGMGKVGGHIHLMLGLGIFMIMLFMHLFFAPYRRLNRAIAQQNFTEASKQLGQMRYIVGVNLILGLVIISVTIMGRYV